MEDNLSISLKHYKLPGLSQELYRQNPTLYWFELPSYWLSEDHLGNQSPSQNNYYLGIQSWTFCRKRVGAAGPLKYSTLFYFRHLSIYICIWYMKLQAKSFINIPFWACKQCLNFSYDLHMIFYVRYFLI